jgi:hypothetical protein
LTFKYGTSSDAGAGLPLLFGSFEQELPDFAVWQTLDDVEKRAMLESPLTAAVLFAARQILAHI